MVNKILWIIFGIVVVYVSLGFYSGTFGYRILISSILYIVVTLDLFKDKKELFDFNFQIMNCGTNTSGKVFKSLLMISVNMSH
jgi:hypothetical protein